MGSSRREFLKSAGVAGAMAVAGGSTRAEGGLGRAQSGEAAVLRSVQTDVLEIGYEESGDPAGFPIILLHGFPYDIRSWDGVVPPLADAGVPGAGAVPARLRHDAVSRSRSAANGGAGRDSPGCLRLRRCARPRAGGAGRVRLGQPRRVHHVHTAPRAGARTGRHRRLFRAGHRVAVGSLAVGGGRGPPLVPVVLQHRAGPGRAGGEPALDRTLPLGDLVADLGVHRRGRTTARRRPSTIRTSSTS